MCDYCTWIEKLLRPPEIEVLPITICTNIINNDKSREDSKKIPKFEPTILVHGTASKSSSRKDTGILLEKIEQAAIVAYREMIKGAESVDSVELAIRHLEDEETSVTESGDNAKKLERNDKSVIKDAIIMDSDSNFGSVGAVANFQHPISLAKKVLRNTDHILIVESGIKNLEIETSDSCQVNDSDEKVSSDSITSDEVEKIVINLENVEDGTENGENGLRIFGAVARDRKGRLACGISTQEDREESLEKSSMSAIGTVLGCGIFADLESCCTISGEDKAIYVYAPARKIIDRLRNELAMKKSNSTIGSLDDFLNEELERFAKATGENSIGVAALNLEGDARVVFTSDYFPWACCKRGIITSGFVKNEISTKEVKDLDMPLDCECH